MRQVATGKVKLHTRTEMLDVVVEDGVARGIVTRDLLTGAIESHSAHAVVLATGGYSNAFFLSTNAKASNATAIWRAHKRGAAFANPCFTQIHPTCIPQSDDTQSKLTLMSESLRNDGRIWVPVAVGDDRAPNKIPEAERDYFLERRYPRLRQPRAARCGIAGRQGHDRRGPRRRPAPQRRLPRLRRCHQPARHGRHPRPLREPLPDVRADHGRGPVPGADAHLPRSALHDGRPVGRLRPDDDGPRPVRDRRGELLRPRREPARRVGADAGAGRRLLHPAGDDRRLPRAAARPGAARRRRRAVRRGRGAGPRARLALPAQRGRALGRLVPPRARQGAVGGVWHGAQRARPGARDGGDRRAARALQGRRARCSATTSR